MYWSVNRIVLHTGITEAAQITQAHIEEALEAIRRFDWSYRWREMLRLVGMEPTSRLTQRTKQLNQLAAMAESEQGR